MSAAALSAFDARCSPSAAITWQHDVRTVCLGLSMSGLGCLARASGPVDTPSRWAATSNVEVIRLTPLTGEVEEARGEKGTTEKVTKQRRGKEGVEQGAGRPLDEEGRLYLDICVGAPEFLFTRHC